MPSVPAPRERRRGRGATVTGAASFDDRPPAQQVDALGRLAARALPAFGLGADEPLVAVNERENTVFRLDIGGRRFAVRVHRAGYHTDAELRSHATWAEALSADGVVATAPVVRTVSGEVVARAATDEVPGERQVTVLRWVDGTMLAASPTAAVEQYRRVGALMAALHDHARRWTPPADFAALRWDADGLLGDDPTWGRFWEAPLVGADDRAMLRRFRAHARERLEAYGTADDRFGLLHGDFLPENLLVGDDGTITLLDFDDGGYGWFLFDIATALFVPLLGPDGAAVQDAFVAGYRSVRPLPDEQLAELGLFGALRAATYIGWMATRSHTQFARDAGPAVTAGALRAVRTLLDDA